MNNKNMMVVTMLMLFNVTFVLPMQLLTPQEEQERRNYICLLSEKSTLGSSQYLDDNGDVSCDLINRDIKILEKDSKQALKNKRSAEGYFYSWMIPGAGKLVTTGSWLGALGAGAFTTGGSILSYKVWNDSSLANFIGNIYSPRDKIEFLMRQSDYNKNILTMVPALPFTFIGTLLFASLAKYLSYIFSSYKNRNSAYINDMQNRDNANQVGIARLKQIIHEHCK